jgi:hypothetical protein
MDDTEMKTTYEPKIAVLLEKIRAEALKRGYQCAEPADWTDETYKWAILVLPEGAESSEAGIDVSVEIAESQVYGDPPGGVNFSLDVVAVAGRIIGGHTPYNYTPDVWVKDREAVADRWTEFSEAVSADVEVVLDRIDSYYAKEAAAG